MAEEFSKYERARILGARALQISMDAPTLLKEKPEFLEDLNFDPLKIAEAELDGGVLPISVRRPLPERRDESLDKIKIEEDSADEKKEKIEKQEEKDISEGGEIMALAKDEESDVVAPVSAAERV